MIHSSTVVTPRAIALSQRAVQQGQLPELVPPQIILAFGDVHCLLDNGLYLVNSLLHRLGVRGSHIGMQGLILSRKRLPILASNFSLLDRSFASDDDLGSCLGLHSYFIKKQ